MPPIHRSVCKTIHRQYKRRKVPYGTRLQETAVFHYNKKCNKCCIVRAGWFGRYRSSGDISMAGFQLTYSTMFAAPPELNELFDRALVRIGESEGREHALFIDGRDVFTERKSVKRSPIDQRRILGQFQIAGAAEVDEAMRVASDAFKGWRSTVWSERVALLRVAARLIEERVRAGTRPVSERGADRRLSCAGHDSSGGLRRTQTGAGAGRSAGGGDTSRVTDDPACSPRGG
jgi:hypothetical protein